MPGGQPSEVTQTDELDELTQQLQGLSTGDDSRARLSSTYHRDGPPTQTNVFLGTNAREETSPRQGATQGGEASFLDEDDLTGFDEKDRKLFGTVFGHIKALQTAVSVPLFEVVHKFDGNPKNYRTWTRELERYAQIAKLSDEELPKIAYLTCSGSVTDFIKRYIEESITKKQKVAWRHLKVLLQKRFGDITDAHQAIAILRQIRQGPGESVQLYGERFLKYAEQAFPQNYQQKETKDFIQRQLVDIFCDGLHFDYLRMKVLRETPRDFDSALELAMREQNLRRRFNLRSDQRSINDNWVNDNWVNENWEVNSDWGAPKQPENYTRPARNWGFANRFENYPRPTMNSGYETQEGQGMNVNPNPNPTWGFTNHNIEPQPQFNQRWPDWSPQMTYPQAPVQADNRQIEPMEIDALRRQLCLRCGGRGHRSKQCPTGQSRSRSSRPRNIYAAEESVEDDDQGQPPRQKRKRPPIPNPQAMQAARDLARKGALQPRDQVPDWVKGAECFLCHFVGHLRKNCPNRQILDRNRVSYYSPMNWNGPQQQNPPPTWNKTQRPNRQGN